MKSKVLWVYAAVITVALVVGFVRHAGFPTDSAALTVLDSGDLSMLAIEVAVVWIFAALAIKARIFEPDGETVHERRASGAVAPVPVPDTGVFVRPRLPRL